MNPTSSLAPDVQVLIGLQTVQTEQRAHAELDNERFGSLKDISSDNARATLRVADEMKAMRSDFGETARRIHEKIEKTSEDQRKARHDANDKIAGAISEVSTAVANLKDTLVKKVEEEVGKVNGKVDAVSGEVTKYKHFLLWRAVLVLVFLLISLSGVTWWAVANYVAPQPIHLQRDVD